MPRVARAVTGRRDDVQRCRCCTHPQRAEIDRAILDGVPNTRIGATYGMDESSVRWHVEHHLSQQLREARMWSTEQLAQKLEDLDRHAQEVLDAAKQSGDHRLRLAGIEVAGRNIERIFRLAVGHDLEERLADLERKLNGEHTDAE